MIITSINLRLSKKNTGALKAYADIIFDECFVVRNLKLVQGKEKMILCMPQRRVNKTTFKDTAHPINSELRTYITNAVIEKYEELIKNN